MFHRRTMTLGLVASACVAILGAAQDRPARDARPGVSTYTGRIGRVNISGRTVELKDARLDLGVAGGSGPRGVTDVGSAGSRGAKDTGGIGGEQTRGPRPGAPRPSDAGSDGSRGAKDTGGV